MNSEAKKNLLNAKLAVLALQDEIIKANIKKIEADRERIDAIFAAAHPCPICGLPTEGEWLDMCPGHGEEKE